MWWQGVITYQNFKVVVFVPGSFVIHLKSIFQGLVVFRSFFSTLDVQKFSSKMPLIRFEFIDGALLGTDEEYNGKEKLFLK